MMKLIKDRVYHYNHMTVVRLGKQKFPVGRSTIYMNVHSPHNIAHWIDHCRWVMKLRRYYSTTVYTLYENEIIILRN